MLRVTVLIDDDDEVMKQLRFCVSVRTKGWDFQCLGRR